MNWSIDWLILAGITEVIYLKIDFKAQMPPFLIFWYGVYPLKTDACDYPNRQNSVSVAQKTVGHIFFVRIFRQTPIGAHNF